jgi:hypothetical protein
MFIEIMFYLLFILVLFIVFTIITAKKKIEKVVAKVSFDQAIKYKEDCCSIFDVYDRYKLLKKEEDLDKDLPKDLEIEEHYVKCFYDKDYRLFKVIVHSINFEGMCSPKSFSVDLPDELLDKKVIIAK